MQHVPHTLRHAVGLHLGLLVAWTLVSCGNEEEPDARQPAEPGLVLAQLSATPKDVKPGGKVLLRVTLADVEDASVSIGVGGQVSQLTLGSEAGALQGTIELTVGAELGDMLITAKGTWRHGDIAGYTLVHLTQQGACPEGSEREAGACVETQSGSPFQVEGMVLVNQPPPEEEDGPGQRLMIHPRASERVEGVLIGCHTDSVGLIPLEQLQDLSQGARSSGFEGEEDRSPLTETRLAEVSELGACENMVIDRNKHLIVVSSRGDSGLAGGLAVFQYGDLSARPLTPPLLVSTHSHPKGMEGLLLHREQLYVLEKPNTIAVYTLSDDGKLDRVGGTEVEEMRSGWGLAADGDRLYIADPGLSDGETVETLSRAGGFAHLGAVHTSPGGHLFVLDISTPTTPLVLGWSATRGATRALAVLPEAVVAAASGTGGVELFDVSQGAAPLRIAQISTPQTATALAYDEGYLLVADWDALLLYDASERGVLRLLGSTDLGAIFEGEDDAAGNGVFATADVSLDAGWWSVCEFDAIYVGNIRPGRRGSSLTLHDRNRTFGPKAASQDTAIGMRLSNGGREALLVRVMEDEFVSSSAGWQALAPGETASVEAELRELSSSEAPGAITLSSNDPTLPERRLRLWVDDSVYEVGDPAPEFCLPLVNACDETGSCDASKSSFGPSVAGYEGKVIFLAFFSTW